MNQLPSIIKIDPKNQTVSLTDPANNKPVEISQHQKTGVWTLMLVIEYDNKSLAVFENLDDYESSIHFLTEKGSYAELQKSAVSTKGDPKKMYGGQSLGDIFGTDHSLHFNFLKHTQDVLGDEVLAQEDDPSYEKVAAYLPPLRLQTFIGTRHTVEKQVFAYGGQSDYLDLGRNIEEIQQVRSNHKVLEGLVGGYLPVLRFVLPVNENRYWEEIVFAEEDPSRLWKQPVWYRMLLVENGEIKKIDYYFNSIPFPKLHGPDPVQFYRELLKVYKVWEKELEPAMKIDVPEKRISNFCKHSLVREMITRSRNHPRYGFLDGYKQHGCGWMVIDCVQPTFNSTVSAHLEWGMFDIAKEYLYDYYEKYVYDDGSLDTMGAEIPGYGRMLANIAQYYQYTGDSEFIVKFRKKIVAIINILFDLRRDSKKIATDDPRHGVLHGWVENDAHMFKDPDSLMMPHFSNSTEVWRGFRDFGEVLQIVGSELSDSELKSISTKMLKEVDEIEKDLHLAIKRSTNEKRDPTFLPNYAGGKESWLWLDGRVYSTMMSSGVLNKEEVKLVTKQQNRLLGLFRGWSQGAKGMLGFDVHGYPYGLIQYDMIREFLLFYYANMAHIHSRGTFTGLELANADGTQETPYCPPAQMNIPLSTKWMLVFEDPRENILWLNRGAPRPWLENGKKIAVTDAPTHWGKVGYELNSEIKNGKISGTIKLPENAELPVINIKLRTPGKEVIKKVEVNGEPWKDFDPEKEIITLTSIAGKQVALKVYY